MRKIESTIDKEGKGDISPAKLASVLGQKRYRGASVYGEGSTELSDLAHAGNMILPEKLPQSGTIPRLLAQPFSLPGTLASYAVQRPAQALMNSPTSANYLAKGMSGNMTPIRNMLLAPSENEILGQARRIPMSMMLQDQNQ